MKCCIHLKHLEEVFSPLLPVVVVLMKGQNRLIPFYEVLDPDLWGSPQHQVSLL